MRARQARGVHVSETDSSRDSIGTSVTLPRIRMVYEGREIHTHSRRGNISWQPPPTPRQANTALRARLTEAGDRATLTTIATAIAPQPPAPGTLHIFPHFLIDGGLYCDTALRNARV